MWVAPHAEMVMIIVGIGAYVGSSQDGHAPQPARETRAGGNRPAIYSQHGSIESVRTQTAPRPDQSISSGEQASHLCTGLLCPHIRIHNGVHP